MKKKYFFGYLFVRAAKGLALLALVIGIGSSLLLYSQAEIAARSVTYQRSPVLHRTLDKLRDAVSDTEQIVASFNASNQSPKLGVQVPAFPAIIDSNADFDGVVAELSRVDQQRQQLKQSVMNRFETSVKAIEAKLRAYAAGLQPPPPPTSVTAPGPVVVASKPSASPSSQQQSLFSAKLGVYEVTTRSATLNQRKEFLKVLGTKAENVDNRARLSEAADQLDLLSKLLPEKIETPSSVQFEPEPTPSNEPRIEQARRLFLSERVAAQLEQIRSDVRQTILTSWALDDAFEQAADTTSAERDKCRVATLAQKGIWLSALSRILTGLLAAALISFLVLVFADLVQTFFDTATNTGIMADAVANKRFP